MDAITFHIQDELGFCTRTSDGVSGMTVTALANFCGVDQPAITQLLNKIRDSDPITNDLPESLKHLAGKDWRLITNDSQNSLFVIDELCHAVLEYYAMDARKYKGKQTAANNYRMVARAGTRVFIWSQTGYTPQSLNTEQLALLQAIPAMQQALAQLQAQVQTLLPPSSDFIPPGWDADVWRSLPPQNKRHFRFLYRRRNFRPSQENQPLALSAATVEQMKERQRAEVKRLVGEVSLEEKQQFQAAKLQKLREFWSQASVEEQKDMPF